MNQFQPQTAIEAHLFDLEILYRSKLKVMEQEDRLAFVFQKLGDHGNSLTLLLRYEGSLNRSYDNALKQLLILQSARQGYNPVPSGRGFPASLPSLCWPGRSIATVKMA
jgi:hypothetical protein